MTDLVSGSRARTGPFDPEAWRMDHTINYFKVRPSLQTLDLKANLAGPRPLTGLDAMSTPSYTGAVANWPFY